MLVAGAGNTSTQQYVLHPRGHVGVMCGGGLEQGGSHLGHVCSRGSTASGAKINVRCVASHARALSFDAHSQAMHYEGWLMCQNLGLKRLGLF
jgi:hypothetical protein